VRLIRIKPFDDLPEGSLDPYGKAYNNLIPVITLPSAGVKDRVIQVQYSTTVPEHRNDPLNLETASSNNK
jgi:hypothetical protein